MKRIWEYFARRPQSQALLVRLILYAVGVITAGTYAAIDWTLVVLLGLGILGIDTTMTKGAENNTTPIKDPKLGVGEIPPALRAAALAVQGYLPGPIGELFEKYGVDGLWAIVRGIEETLKRPPTQAETDQKALEGL